MPTPDIPSRHAATAVRIEGLTKTYGADPYAVTALAGIDTVFFRGTATAVMT